MYSYEDRMRAVRLYLKLGKRVGATIRQLGYPTKNSLKSWHLEYERCHDLRTGYVRSRPVYSAERKKVAVDHYLGQGRCAAATLRALGYPSRGTLAAWIEELHPEIGKRIVGRATGSIPKSPAVKQAAVIELCTREESARLLAQKAGVSRPTLYNWKNQLLGREAPASMKRQKKPAPDSERAKLEQQVESLRRDVRQLQLEHDILKKANELIKKGMGIVPQLLSNREKTMLVDVLKNTYTLSELLAVLGLARSSYFYHRARLLVADKYAGARRVIADIFEVNHRCYGYRRIRAALGRQKVVISEKVVRRLMRQDGLTAATARRRRYRSYGGEISPAPENIINRDFRAGAPNEKWLTDITEFQIPAGKVYLSPLIDCFDGLVVSWTIGTRPDAELVNTMLDEGIKTVANSNKRPVVHSDRGAHYRWPGWLARIRDAKLVRSMSRKGCSPDNAACEGFFGRLKTEWFHSRDWRTTTVEQFIEVLDSYIRWYNAKRIKVSLGALSPLEYRESLGIAA
ncbi:transposase InsO family protein [Paraburkholderia sp. BL6669N2]|uniref:IS3 family transposase n=1 Tax=Paraburkholderia sp. BL6669N2 TaxID=1938807 RepID=UPI000E2392BD|nr:IS3 family transposase [Paraburkholderia sp. BL6669N2]REG51612.1 transposase InsO family protein [Paraburkholderia sp. BL6669N2]REG57746.1 transposase InsO family protein [Paraburkholderia sp. BL6669N2]REG57754.1 transposase InsO family protein [Paraburkholderia sp. BL6669N2]REG58525.1 transposase InsO family protein [Paraburkholderia sp. BL6669N2]